MADFTGLNFLRGSGGPLRDIYAQAQQSALREQQLKQQQFSLQQQTKEAAIQDELRSYWDQVGGDMEKFVPYAMKYMTPQQIAIFRDKERAYKAEQSTAASKSDRERQQKSAALDLAMRLPPGEDEDSRIRDAANLADLYEVDRDAFTKIIQQRMFHAGADDAAKSEYERLLDQAGFDPEERQKMIRGKVRKASEWSPLEADKFGQLKTTARAVLADPESTGDAKEAARATLRMLQAKEFEETMIPVEMVIDGKKVQGFIPKPGVSASTTEPQPTGGLETTGQAPTGLPPNMVVTSVGERTQLPSGVTEALGGMKAYEREFESMDKLIEDTIAKTGTLPTGGGAVGEYVKRVFLDELGLSPDEARNKLRGKVAGITAALYAMRGKQLSDKEMLLALGQIPQMGEDPRTFYSKYSEFKDFMNNMLEGKVQAFQDAKYNIDESVWINGKVYKRGSDTANQAIVEGISTATGRSFTMEDLKETMAKRNMKASDVYDEVIQRSLD